MPDSVKTVHDVADTMLPELPEKAIYIGWSNGGLTAQSIAARYPGRVTGFIGIATTPKFITSENWIGFLAPGYEQIILPLIKDSTIRDLLYNAYKSEFANIEPKPPMYYHSLKICDARPDIPPHNLKKLLYLVDYAKSLKNFCVL